MDLLEYQAKKLFSQVGIPTLASQTIYDPRELKKLQIPYPVVLKSQVRAGGRGKAGGVRFVENTIDAIAAARTIFNLSILGQYPQVILAEARYNAQQEFFLAVVLDYQLKRPVLLGSSKGGVDVEALLQHLKQVVIEEEFSPFYARHLTIEMGLRGSLILSVSAIIEKMYRLFAEKDLDLIEINPLGINARGEVMALDGKIAVNDSACGRHPDLLLLNADSQILSKESRSGSLSSEITLTKPQWLNWDNQEGNVGIICNGFGLALITWDLISQGKGQPACCFVLGAEPVGTLLPNFYLARQFGNALQQMRAISGLKVVLINVLASPETSETVAGAIAAYFHPEEASEENVRPQKTRGKTRSSRKRHSINQLHFVIRLVGGKIDSFKTTLEGMPVFWTDDIEEAVEQTISLAKGD